jgi:triosephosphate isomerase
MCLHNGSKLAIATVFSLAFRKWEKERARVLFPLPSNPTREILIIPTFITSVKNPSEQRFPRVFLVKVISLNFKTYKESTGNNGLELAAIADEIASRNPSVMVMVCPQLVQTGVVASLASRAVVFSQHSDLEGQGKFTGRVSLESVKAMGCKGTVLNHAERKLPHDLLRKTIARANSLGLQSLVCAMGAKEAVEIAKMKPTMIAVELPHLIGSRKSITRIAPEEVEDAVKGIRKVNKKVVILAGAGVNSRKDAAKAIELGAQGVMLATFFVLSRNPRKALEELVDGVSAGKKS